MSDNNIMTRGQKRKSSDLAGYNEVKKEKLDDDAPKNPTEKLFNNQLCIRSILAYLPIEDLANVAQASHFFKMNSQVVFTTAHAATIQIEYDFFEEKQMVFQQFGRLATKVIVSSKAGDENEEDGDLFDGEGCAVLATVGHFCGSNLKDLTLRRMLIDISPKSIGFFAENQFEVRNLLGTISKLSLMNVCIKSRFFEYLRSLEELWIHSCCHLEQLPQVTTLPQLRFLHIGACPFWSMIPGANFNEFLNANPSIEKLNYHFIDMGPGHFESICSLPNLTHLEMHLIDGGKDEILAFRKMKKLKGLKLHIDPKRRDLFSKLRKMISSEVDVLINDLY